MSDHGDRAVGYVRVSTLRQVEEGNSIASQTLSLQRYARNRGLRLRSKDIVIDDGVSGVKPLWERDGGSRLLGMLESGRYHHLIVAKIDRLSRTTSDSILSIQDISGMGIGFHVINLSGQSLDTTSAVGKMLITFVAGVAQMERDQVSERTLEAMQYLRETGRKFTRALYGWDVDDEGMLVPNWREQARIDFMKWQMDYNDVSATKVAHMLNKRGWKGKLGGDWYAETVLNVTGNDYHKRRKEFKPRPKWWGSKPWHRKPRPAQQRDEKVVAKVPAGKWGKDDLS